MRKMISILTLCLVTGLNMTSPVIASTVQPYAQISDNVNITQSGLSGANLCLNQPALLLDGAYVNGSCMKLQPKYNTAIVNSYFLHQFNSNSVLCLNNIQQQNPTTITDATTAATDTISAQTNKQTTISTNVPTGTNTDTNSSKVSAQSSTYPKVSAQTNTCSNASVKSSTYPKVSIQSSTCPSTNTVTKETRSTKTTTSTSTQATTSTANPVSNSNNSTSSSSFREFQKKVVELVNKERVAAGLNALSENSALDNVATLKSEDMVKLNYFSHTSPTYGSPFQMLTQFNISYTAAGENIAYGQSTPEEVMNGWMNSPGHRANILNTNFTQIGVGIAQKANGQLIWTQTFTRQ